MVRSVALLALLLSSAVIAAPPLSGIDKSAIDTNVRPGNGFDDYANGAWRAKAEIPPDQSSVGVFYEMSLVAEKRNARVIEEATAAKGAMGTPMQRIADYYAAFMDQAGIEVRGMAPIQADLTAIAGLKDREALSAMLGAQLRADVDPLNTSVTHTENLFGLFVTQDLNDPARSVPYVLQGGLGMPDRDYYLSGKPDMVSIRTAYRAYVAKLFALAGIADSKAEADRVIDLETKIAAAHADILTTQDVHKANNPWRRADFATKAPGIDWEAFWHAAELGKQTDFIAWQAATVTKLSALVASEPLANWKAWATFHRINTRSFALPEAIDKAHFDFYGRTLNGTPAQRPRHERGVEALNADLRDDVGKIYVSKYFPASSKARIEAMVKNILAAFDARLVALDWMAPATKTEARHKISTLKVGIGYPDKWRDYTGLVIRADDPIGNRDRAELSEYRYQLAKLGRPVDRDEWWLASQTVNAVNLPLQNALNFPAAILDTPIFDPAFDDAANYGSIGAAIGHEISHSFDNIGADFDAEGRLRNWWTPADFQRFQGAGAALAAQYDAYEALPGLHLNGQQELGENIADVAGLTAAHDAYLASLKGRPSPTIDGLSGDQRFFLAFARNFRSKIREQALRAGIATNAHAPPMFRTETVRNVDTWYRAFAVGPGEKRYLAPGQRVHVW